jgi:glycosyltransferase involved in cell wall biosynthesis
MNGLPVSVIILTMNESRNIRDCLESVKNFSDDIIIVDSGSTDDTLSIASEYTNQFYLHPFENYARQRNWALQNVNLKYEWILNMDADHRLTHDFIKELSGHFEKGIPETINGFMASRRTLFMNKWIRHGGHYPVYHAALFRKGYGECEDKEYDQHFIITGESLVLKGDIEDIITDSLNTFINRHNKWATLEANDILDSRTEKNKINADRSGNKMQKRRYQRMRYYSYPLFWRVFIYFFYRFILKMGFLDGRKGMIFHFMQGFWFRFLVDSKIYELQSINKMKAKSNAN